MFFSLKKFFVDVYMLAVQWIVKEWVQPEISIFGQFIIRLFSVCSLVVLWLFFGLNQRTTKEQTVSN
jgi:hypothetical protein